MGFINENTDLCVYMPILVKSAYAAYVAMAVAVAVTASVVAMVVAIW